ncbi:putative aspartic proteinase nepenthesin-2-like [Cocos nucifera]|uniref:Putative aspartic proteinase nepenthesin-2-like n=1 Tax=Cocos nucifera TaxID=13894 RepID=A0A8K0IE41_COCNU|nr:putative aspartic proteinase nepenthesin-2-like [Cocos nucifera]KAG1354316.1 putative aspartic proteinase nepenthesin-2-like [Cocos nucifera]
MAPARDRIAFASSLLALLLLLLLAADAAAGLGPSVGLALGAQAIVLQLLLSYVSSARPDRLRHRQLQSAPAGARMVLQDELLSNG